MNHDWCNMVVARELCTSNIELLSVPLHPFYLPREFPQIFVCLVYIHPEANVDMAPQTVAKSIQRLQRIAPDAPFLVMRDINHCKPIKSLCNFYQDASCPTHNSKYLDLCFVSIKGLTYPFTEHLWVCWTIVLFTMFQHILLQNP